MLVTEPRAGWLALLRLQRYFDFLPVDDRAWSHDDAVTALVEDLGGNPLSPSNVRLRYRSVLLNRTRKHRRRAELHDRFLAERTVKAFHENSQLDAVWQRELLLLVRAAVTIQEWQILWRLAEGFSYEELSSSTGMSQSQLRTHACRIRKRVRSQLIGKI